MPDPDVGNTRIRESRSGACVIFVHGILSDGKKAWTNDAGTFWPELLAAEDKLKDVGIYVLSYRSDILCQNYNLSDIVDSVGVFFELEEMWAKGPLIFVCHSMGGIAVRRFIVSRQVEFIDHHNTVGLFLVASPSLGSQDANRIHFLASLVGNSQEEALRFSQKNVWLNDLDKDFLRLKESEKIPVVGRELVEDEPIKVMKYFGLAEQIVEPFSAARYFPEPYKVPFSNHISIAKPANRDAIQHKLLVHFINGINSPKKAPPVAPPSPLVKVLGGKWAGHEHQGTGPGGKPADYPIFLSISFDENVLKGGFRFVWEKDGVVQVDETLPFEGFIYERYLLLTFKDVVSGKVQFGALLLQLSEDGKTLSGLDVGIGYTVKRLVTGECTLQKLPD